MKQGGKQIIDKQIQLTRIERNARVINNFSQREWTKAKSDTTNEGMQKGDKQKHNSHG